MLYKRDDTYDDHFHPEKNEIIGEFFDFPSFKPVSKTVPTHFNKYFVRTLTVHDNLFYVCSDELFYAQFYMGLDHDISPPYIRLLNRIQSKLQLISEKAKNKRA
jgi:hypothetical protein